MDVTLHLPVRRYVYKYCCKLFSEPGKPYDWRLTKHPKEGLVIYALLERTPHRYEKPVVNEAMLNIFIPSNISRTKGWYIPQEGIDAFNEYIRQVIMDEILQFHTGIQSQIGLKAIEKVTCTQYLADKRCRVVRLLPKEAKNFFWQKSIIYDILKKYDITEDDMSFDSVVKHLQRYGNYKVAA